MKFSLLQRFLRRLLVPFSLLMFLFFPLSEASAFSFKKYPMNTIKTKDGKPEVTISTTSKRRNVKIDFGAPTLHSKKTKKSIRYVDINDLSFRLCNVKTKACTSWKKGGASWKNMKANQKYHVYARDIYNNSYYVTAGGEVTVWGGAARFFR